MKVKMQKSFLPADYAMELYERFHSLKQKGMTVEEYTKDQIFIFGHCFGHLESENVLNMLRKRFENRI